MIRLRPLEPEDLELMYTIENDRSLWWMSGTSAPYSYYLLREYIANNATDIYKDEQVRFVIECDGQAAGMIDLFDFSPKNCRAELGVALLRSFQKRGIAREAISRIAEYARDVVHMHQIYAIVPVSNHSSVSMLEACGFEHSGTLHNWINHGGKYEDAHFMQLFLAK